MQREHEYVFIKTVIINKQFHYLNKFILKKSERKSDALTINELGDGSLSKVTRATPCIASDICQLIRGKYSIFCLAL